MSKQYGLIVPNKDAKPVKRPQIFDSDSDSESPVEKPTSLKRLKPQDKQTQIRAVEEDPTVYQYDEIYDEMDKKRKDLLKTKNQDKKPKYITKLLAAADRRKRENERRIERQVQKERESEGEQFKDKEAFVTSAYKKKLEEMKAMEEEEKREEYLEEIGSVKKQGNLDGFYRHLYEQKVNFQDTVNVEDIKQEENEEMEEGSSEKREEQEENREEAFEQDTKSKEQEGKHSKKRKYRRHEESDEELEESAENKEHLHCNLDADSDFSIDSSDEESTSAQPENKEAVKQPKVEEKDSTNEEKDEIEKSVDVVPEPVKVAKIDIWKKRTVGEAFTAALLRYHERKQSRQLF